tara:strand:- start:81574 stop:82962 length:1389 start_codon:yes stop_codon:yes gene_type:complete
MSNINQNIQASHKVLSLLEKANAHSENIIDGLPGIFLILNEKHEILRGNVESSNIFGIDSEDLLRTHFPSLFKSEVWAVFQHHLKCLKNDSNTNSVKFELAILDHSQDAARKSFYWDLSRIKGSNDAEDEIYSLIAKDISELREAEHRLSSIFTNIPLGIFTINERGNIEDNYSNHLLYLLGTNDLKNISLKDALFQPIEKDLSRDEKHGIDNIYACLNQHEKQFEQLVSTFPANIYFYRDNKKEGKHLQISYKSVSYDNFVKQVLIIIEDRSAFIESEKEQERANLLEKQSKAIYESAIRDPLTGLYTRLYMADRVEALLNSHNRHNIADASLVLFDVDHFKDVNDTHGHDVGDKVLKEIASIILQQARNTDIPIRFGGEEFMVFLPADSQCGLLFAERVRKSVELLVVHTDETSISVTISGGISSHQVGEGLDTLIKRADQMLYKAKKEGRNKNIEELHT